MSVQPSDHQQFQWSYAYRECALYNKALKSQIDRENKIFNKDYTQGGKIKKEYINLFNGYDNSQPFNFDLLKKQTFKDIFSMKNNHANSIKRSINYSNYTKQDLDIISQQEHNPAYKEFKDNIFNYEQIKPPAFDLQQNLKQARKREKASLDKQSKKFIIKNIKTCTDFARTQRERVRQVHLKRGGRNMTIGSLDYNNPSQTYNNFLEEDDDINQRKSAGTPSNLRHRRIQLMKRNNENSSTIDGEMRNRIMNNRFSIGGTIQNQEPIVASNLSSLERPQTGKIIQNLPNYSNQKITNSFANADKSLVFLNRKTKTAIGTRRPLKEEDASLVANTFLDNQNTRFRLQRNPSPIQVHQRNQDFSTIQNNNQISANVSLIKNNKRRNEVNIISKTNEQKVKASRVDQMKKRSLSSYCKQRKIGSKKHSVDALSDRSIAELSQKASNAYQDEDKKPGQQRIQNLNKFLQRKRQSSNYDQAYNYALTFLDKLALVNNQPAPDKAVAGLTLEDYQWNQSKKLPLKNIADISIDLKEEETLIDSVLFNSNIKKDLNEARTGMMVIDNEQKQQGENQDEYKNIEDQLEEERKRRQELEGALKRLSVKIKEVSRKQRIDANNIK